MGGISLMRLYAIEFDSVRKQYRENIVLSRISFQIEPGEFIGLVGVNGAGKTTIIKCLLDFAGLTSGAIKIYGVTHTETDSRSKLVFLPEKFMPPYYLTGKDFLKYSLELHKINYDEHEVNSILDVLDLDRNALLKPVRQYSKGMAQKIGLASCLLSEKELFIFDEPMSGLDPKARANLKQYLLMLKDKGKSLFFSTHLLDDVNFLCDRIIILHGGDIRFFGSPAECIKQYKVDNLEQAYMQCIGNNTGEPVNSTVI